MPRFLHFLSLLIGGIGVATAAAESAPAAEPPSAMTLAAGLKSDFFQFFNLANSCDPVTVGQGTWHCYRPTGPAFRPLVELDVLTDAQDRIVTSRLAIDRAFIDSPRNAPFARDIAKSYFAWSVAAPGGDLAVLFANIGDMTQSGGTVIMRQSAAPPVPADATGGYKVYLGKTDAITLKRPSVTVALTNFNGALPTQHIYAGPDAPAAPGKRWLALDVTPAR